MQDERQKRTVEQPIRKDDDGRLTEKKSITPAEPAEKPTVAPPPPPPGKDKKEEN